MSFYIYYGTINNDLCVAVLPEGTAERGDTVHLFSKQYKKTIASFKIKNVSVTDDGDDLFTFDDGYYSHQIESSKGYRQLTLTTKGLGWSNWGTTTKTELTRYYDQPQAAIAPSDAPKIWSGALSCHKHANEEGFFVAAPQGLGNGKPGKCSSDLDNTTPVSNDADQSYLSGNGSMRSKDPRRSSVQELASRSLTLPPQASSLSSRAAPTPSPVKSRPTPTLSPRP